MALLRKFKKTLIRWSSLFILAFLLTFSIMAFYTQNIGRHKEKRLYVANMNMNSEKLGASSRLNPQGDVQMTSVEVFQDRQKRVDMFCQMKNYTIGNVNKVFVHKSGVVYCHVAKAGCTFWKRMFRFAGDKIFNSFSSPWKISRISVHLAGVGYGIQYDPSLHGPAAFPTRLLVTRDPFSRILSSYLDKFYLPDFWMGYSSNWILRSTVPFRYPPLIEQDDFLWTHFIRMTSRLGLGAIPDRFQIVNESGCVKFLTFLQFVDKIVLRYSEPHWAPTNLLCDPCKFKPTHISRMETFTQDARPVLRTMGMEKYLDGLDKDKQIDEELRALTDYNFKLVMTNTRLQNCMGEEELAYRLWTNFQWKGYISPEVDYIVPTENVDVKKDFFRQLWVARLQGLQHPDTMKNAKVDFMKKVYSSLRKEHFEALCRHFEKDINLFDYEKKRDELAKLYVS